MRLAVPALAVVLCWGLTSAAQERKDEKEKGKKEVTSTQGQFKILLPPGAKDPTPPVNQIGKKSGDTMHAISADCGQGRTCIIAYTDLKNPPEKIQPKALIEGVEEAVGMGDLQKVEKGKEGAFGEDKLPGYEFTVTFKDKGKFKTRMLVHGKRVYTIMIGDAKDFASSPEATDVLNSFKLIK